MPTKIPILENIRKLLLNNAFQSLASKDHLLIRMIDPYSGKSIVQSMPYHKETHIIRIPVEKNDKLWQKFADGYPLEVFLQGKYHYGWGELINQPAESEKEWAVFLENQPDMAFNLSANLQRNLADHLQDLKNAYDLLRIEISKRS